MKRKNLFKINKKGFTLVELLVAISIIGVLASLSVISVVSARKKARVTIALNDIAQIRKSIEMIGNDTGYWPNHQPINIVCTDIAGGCPDENEICGPDEGGTICSTSIADDSSGIINDDGVTPFSGWSGPYMNKIPLDPWGHEYFFDTDYLVTIDNEPCDGGGSCINAVAVGSYGPNGDGKNLYDSEDIIMVLIR